VPVRIYALAKELKLDSKDLVDLCTRIGIPNKGSALASLEDDEVVRIRKYLAGGSAPEAAAPAAAPRTTSAAVGAPIREPLLPTGVVRELATPRPAPSPAAAAPLSARGETPAPAAAAPPPPTTPAPAAPPEPSPEIEPEPAAPPIAASDEAPAAPVRPAAEPGGRSMSREDYMGPSSGGGRVRVLGSRRSAPAAGKGTAAETKKPTQTRREPVINLARIPKGPQAPLAAPKSSEPAPQKPEFKLTKDLLSGHRQGMNAPLENLLPKTPGAAGEAGARRSKPGQPGEARPGARPGGAAAPGGLTEFKAAADKAKGKKGRTAEEEEEISRRGVSGVAAARDERKRRRPALKTGEEGDEGERRRSSGGRTLHRRGTNTAAPRKDKAVLELPCTVRSFSEAAGVSAVLVSLKLKGMGIDANINSNLSAETAQLLAVEMGVDLDFRQPASLEEDIVSELESREDAPENLEPRAPIVTFLGHVDHGKTSLLDYLIGTRIVAGEAGGITQHIRAYQVNKDGRTISFVDTPGHEAFTEMRARGANVTDIAVLVIAAEDGIMPQTEEAISHAKAAGVPIVVAMNKIDLPGADPNRVLTQMTEHGLTPSEWGGDVEVVRTSAITGEGMDTLLETLLTIAELNDYRANPNRSAVGVCLEAGQAADKGVIAKVIVQTGSLKPGDIVLCGSSHGRVKALYDTLNPNKQLASAGPSMPVNITGLDSPPPAGEKFYVISDISKARELAEGRATHSRAQSLSGTSPKVSFETFQELLQTGKLGKSEERVVLNLIIRADARGSLEAIEKELGKLDHPEVDVRILQRSVGGITVADVTLASASDAVIVGFNVIPDEAARALADERNVEIRRYDIIYKLAEDIRAILEGRLKPEQRVVELGRALVKTVFMISRVGVVAGCYVAQGAIERGCRIRVNRDGRTIGDYALESLKRIKEDVKEVPRGMECGIKLAGFNDLKQDDVLEAYRIEEVARTLGP
jgi:translation initiation factor IF-2